MYTHSFNSFCFGFFEFIQCDLQFANNNHVYIDSYFSFFFNKISFNSLRSSFAFVRYTISEEGFPVIILLRFFLSLVFGPWTTAALSRKVDRKKHVRYFSQLKSMNEMSKLLIFSGIIYKWVLIDCKILDSKNKLFSHKQEDKMNACHVNLIKVHNSSFVLTIFFVLALLSYPSLTRTFGLSFLWRIW